MADGERRLARGNFSLLPWTPAADDVRHLRIPPRCREPGNSILAEYLGEEDPRLEHMLGMQAVATHWGELPPREQEILLMRFHGGMTQAQIGQRLCISQMHVSRLIAHALGYLRSQLLDLKEPYPTARSPEP